MIDSQQIDGLVSFDRGYIAYETGYAGPPAAWFSADGRDWARVELARGRCSDNPVGFGGAVWHGATNGTEVMLVGHEMLGCDGHYQPASWITSDGVTWQTSTFVEPPRGPASRAHHVWAMPDGWEANVQPGDGSNVVWRSSDGLTWHEVANLGQDFLYAVVATTDGTRLGSISGRDRQWLATSTDGLTWREIAAPRHEPVRVILPGSPDGQDPWVVIFTSPDGTATTTATSFDLAVWEQRSSPMQQIEAIVRTRYGLVEISTIPCFEGGEEIGGPVVEVEASECPAAEYTTYLSHDGLSWDKLASHVPAMGIADGPAGVIGIARWEAREPGGLTVWRLGPSVVR